MAIWGRRLIKLFLLLVVFCALYFGVGYGVANRAAEPVSQAEFRQGYERAIGWVKANEAHVLSVENAALWWMLQAAGERTGDKYLQDLVGRSIAHAYGGSGPASPWKRMLDPKAEVSIQAGSIEALSPYQRFFYHAVTCLPVEIPGGDTTLFAEQNMCKPMLTKVLLGDPVCTTHQYMGLLILHRTGCAIPHGTASLEDDLLNDIEHQLAVDPVFRDPFIQRVLIMAWSGRGERVKPIWMKRIMLAQETDGSWKGYRRIPELPLVIQPWYWREKLAQQWPHRMAPDVQPLDFHATAQGVLLMALSMPPGSMATASH